LAKIKKIIFLSGTPISKIVGDKIDPYWFQDHDFEVEYWGLQNIYYDKTAINGYFSGNSDYKYIFPNTRIFSSKSEVSRALIDLNNKVIICFIDFRQQNDFWILRLFKKYKIRFYMGPKTITIQVPIESDSKIINIIESKYKKIFKKNFFKRVGIKLLKVIFRYTDYYQHPIYIFSCGTKGRGLYAEISKESKYISIPSVDIIGYKAPSLIQGKYCVYVENNFHFSPDASLNEGDNHNVNIELYEKNICSMFDLIEDELGLNIIISASGKYAYPDESIFGDREIIYFKTNQLIQHSEMVIGHYSQGISQAIVNFKPLMLIQDHSFNVNINISIRGIAKIFKKKSLYATELTPSLIRQQFVIDKKHYQNLIQEYFCEKGVKIESKELIRNTLKNFKAHRERTEREQRETTSISVRK
jgi:hypothetical protein